MRVREIPGVRERDRERGYWPEAFDQGERAALAMVPLEDNPYTGDADNDDREFNPDACRAWRKGWQAETRRKLAAALRLGRGAGA